MELIYFENTTNYLGLIRSFLRNNQIKKHT